MKTRGTTKVYGVIGCPVEHSLSPMMHNLYSERTQVDMTYVPFRVEEGCVGDAVRGAYALNIGGLNVTVPHKQAVMEYLAEIDEDARAIGAVNTLVRTESGYRGYNTDAEGLWRAMQGAGMQIREQVCILIGAGGAAKAAAYVLAREGARKVYVLNRSVEKAQQLAEEINRHMQQELLTALPLHAWDQIGETGCLAVQTTSVGMFPNMDAAPIEDAAFYQKLSHAFDVVYTPMETQFMKRARAAGAVVCNGLDMLLYQGIVAYELWNPEVVISPSLIAEARELLKRCLGGKAG
ncbi:MAG: shikimate dehydrogenase [Lachnospiraceae bacterium]|nr:shikimate dehydrogenase [Lachnospiraceae bacterium]